MNLPTPPATAIPADQIGAITPSQVMKDARVASTRPEHVLDAAAVAIASVMATVSGTSFDELLPEIAADVNESARGWLDENLNIPADREGFTYEQVRGDDLGAMLDHVAHLVAQYDCYAC
ncbi:hypothetical protein FXF51_01475 [Nonomuraea sp. PA05]|uniref:hypothetical protein n=1 Tax=Nonomuraea sp. PA05 TaxID=2604466 RepID=UPI0011D920E7|nr:hypothetical protein [Nonomuraea sp. PA05]TYB71131.1 hypothetical protein FXF51_01475 [Nonomuraea sp. PA05]